MMNILSPLGTGPESVDFFDPIPDIYELTTGKDWDTGEELGGYDRIVEPFLQYFVGKKVGKVGKLAAKADNKLLGGRVTKKLGKWMQPVKNKRDEFIEWACSKGGLFSERALPTAADPGGSSPNGKRLLKLQKRQEESHISTSRGNHLKKLLNN
jgi:hypothetical protein